MVSLKKNDLIDLCNILRLEVPNKPVKADLETEISTYMAAHPEDVVFDERLHLFANGPAPRSRSRSRPSSSRKAEAEVEVDEEFGEHEGEESSISNFFGNNVLTNNSLCKLIGSRDCTISKMVHSLSLTRRVLIFFDIIEFLAFAHSQKYRLTFQIEQFFLANHAATTAKELLTSFASYHLLFHAPAVLFGLLVNFQREKYGKKAVHLVDPLIQSIARLLIAGLVAAVGLGTFDQFFASQSALAGIVALAGVLVSFYAVILKI